MSRAAISTLHGRIERAAEPARELLTPVLSDPTVLGLWLAPGRGATRRRVGAAITFGCAYVFGVSLTVGPLLREGVALLEAVADASYPETPSITVMEIVAIGGDLLLASGAHLGDVLFWTALVFSLSLGFVAALPVNVALVAVGVKEGMENPDEMGRRTAGQRAADQTTAD